MDLLDEKERLYSNINWGVIVNFAALVVGVIFLISHAWGTELDIFQVICTLIVLAFLNLSILSVSYFSARGLYRVAEEMRTKEGIASGEIKPLN